MRRGKQVWRNGIGAVMADSGMLSFWAECYAPSVYQPLIVLLWGKQLRGRKWVKITGTVPPPDRGRQDDCQGPRPTQRAIRVKFIARLHLPAPAADWEKALLNRLHERTRTTRCCLGVARFRRARTARLPMTRAKANRALRAPRIPLSRSTPPPVCFPAVERMMPLDQGGGSMRHAHAEVCCGSRVDPGRGWLGSLSFAERSTLPVADGKHDKSSVKCNGRFTAFARRISGTGAAQRHRDGDERPQTHQMWADRREPRRNRMCRCSVLRASIAAPSGRGAACITAQKANTGNAFQASDSSSSEANGSGSSRPGWRSPPPIVIPSPPLSPPPPLVFFSGSQPGDGGSSTACSTANPVVPGEAYQGNAGSLRITKERFRMVGERIGRLSEHVDAEDGLESLRRGARRRGRARGEAVDHVLRRTTTIAWRASAACSEVDHHRTTPRRLLPAVAGSPASLFAGERRALRTDIHLRHPQPKSGWRHGQQRPKRASGQSDVPQHRGPSPRARTCVPSA
jgi:hypothetical protein